MTSKGESTCYLVTLPLALARGAKASIQKYRYSKIVMFKYIDAIDGK